MAKIGTDLEQSKKLAEILPDMDEKEITEETIAMNERLKKLERETKSSLILSKMKCKDFHYNDNMGCLEAVIFLNYV